MLEVLYCESAIVSVYYQIDCFKYLSSNCINHQCAVDCDQSLRVHRSRQLELLVFLETFKCPCDFPDACINGSSYHTELMCQNPHEQDISYLIANDLQKNLRPCYYFIISKSPKLCVGLWITTA
jgi:hypothetical protein